METVIKKSSLRRNLLPGSVPSQNGSVRTASPKQERKLPVKLHIAVKSTQKSLLSIISPLPLPNYEELITKDLEVQTSNTFFVLLNDGCSHFIILIK